MTILNNTLLEYLEQLKSKAPTPGGGSVSGITGMQGVGLILMVLNLTIGKKKYEENEKFLIEEKIKNEDLYDRFLQSADKDIMSYDKFAKAYKMPHRNEEETKDRNIAINHAALNAIYAPLETMELCLQGVENIESILLKTNKMAISDLIAAAIMFDASCKSTSLNVKINAKFLQDKTQGQEFIYKAERLAEQVSYKVNEIIEIGVKFL